MTQEQIVRRIDIDRGRKRSLTLPCYLHTETIYTIINEQTKIIKLHDEKLQILVTKFQELAKSIEILISDSYDLKDENMEITLTLDEIKYQIEK